MKRERMMEFLRELDLDPSNSVDVRLDPFGWAAKQFVLDAEGRKVMFEGGDGYVRYTVSGDWE